MIIMANSNLISIDLFYKESKTLITYENMNVIRTFEGKYGPKMKESIGEIFNRFSDPSKDKFNTLSIHMDFSFLEDKAIVCVQNIADRKITDTFDLEKEDIENIEKVLWHDPIVGSIYRELRFPKNVYNPYMKSINIVYRNGVCNVVSNLINEHGTPCAYEYILSASNQISRLLSIDGCIRDMNSDNNITTIHIGMNNGSVTSIHFGYENLQNSIEIVDANDIIIPKFVWEDEKYAWIKECPVCEYFWLDENSPSPGNGIVRPIIEALAEDPICGWIIS